MKDPNNTRDTMPRRGSPLWIYILCVIALGLAAFTLALRAMRSDDLSALLHDPVFWVLGAFIVFGEVRPIMTPGGGEDRGATTSITFAFAALLYAGLPAAVLLQTIAVIARGVLHHHATHRTLFNVAQSVLSLGAAGLVLVAFGIHATPAAPWVPHGSDLVAMGLAAAAYFACNDVLVARAVSLHERMTLAKALRWDLGYQVLVHLALLSLAPIVVVAMDRSAAFVPLIGLPFLAVYLNAAMSIRREHQALHDGLTGLANRKLLIQRTEEALSEARRRQAGKGGGEPAADRQVGLFLLDLDRFKEVNDTLGHLTGDRLLRLVAHRLTHSVRPGDLVARLGGDEFAVLLPTVRDARAAREVAVRLRAALSEPVRLDGTSFGLDGSVGIALHPGHATDFEGLLKCADVAMYVAKEARTGVEIYSAAKDRNSPARLSMLGELRRAVDNGELALYFQPKIDLSDGHLVGMEALLRWRHPRLGLLGPEQFLPLAEQTYLMRTITHHVVHMALDQAASWWRQGLKVQVAVNVSGRDLFDAALTETIAAGLARRDLPPACLQLEITERILMTEPAYAADTVQALAKLGVSLSLDDFGTGYSSLVRLRRLPVDEVKIDSSFVAGVADPSSDQGLIVRSLIDLLRTLGLRSVAEGVEDRRTAQLLRGMGCDAAQGWHFSRPMDAATATGWLLSGSRRAPEPAA